MVRLLELHLREDRTLKATRAKLVAAYCFCVTCVCCEFIADLWFLWVPFPEPDVASSDATNMQCTFYSDGDSYVINGKKWWSSGKSSPLN